MQDKLKNRFENEELDDEFEPSTEHRSNFMRRLDEELKHKPEGVQLHISYSFMRVAAIAILLITAISFAWFWDHSKVETGPQSMSLADVSEKYKEVEFFYQEQMSARLVSLELADNEQNQLVYKEALQRLSQLDENYNKLENDLAQNPGNSRIVYAMIKNYQLRITVLETLLNKLNIKETQKAEENEKANLYPIFPLGIHLIPTIA
jgi:hypothetical protein